MNPIRSIFVLLAVSLAAVSGARADAVIGQAAPAFSRPAADGKTVSLSQFAGKTVVLEWFNSGCPFVKKHYGSKNMQNLQKKYTAKGVVWLAVISSSPGSQGHHTPSGAKAEAESLGSHATHVLIDEDGSMGRAYGAKTTPHMYIINGQGKLVYAGGIDDKPSSDAEDIPSSKNYVAAALDELLAGKGVSVATSKPYGCSVKYKN